MTIYFGGTQINPQEAGRGHDGGTEKEQLVAWGRREAFSGKVMQEPGFERQEGICSVKSEITLDRHHGAC